MYNLAFDYTELQNFWEMGVGAYTAVLGIWFYYIVITFISIAYYIKSQKLVNFAVMYTMLVVIIAPVASQVPTGEYAVYLSLIFGIAITLSSIILRRKSYV